jgi:hypothetical protein
MLVYFWRVLFLSLAARQLLAFVTGLDELIRAVTRATSWSDKVAAARNLLDALLGSDRQRLRWPDDERDDLDRVVDALSRLAGLDEIEPRPSTDTFRRAFDAELDAGRGRTNPFGAGVLYVPLASAVGHDLDAVFVVGMAEGLCPAGRREEALLPERLREATGQLVTPDQAMAAQHRTLLAALSAAPPGRRTLTFPRGDLRSNRRALPSRWMLATVAARAGRPVYSTGFAALGGPDVDVVASFAAGVQRGAASPGEHDLADVSRFVAAGGDALRHPAMQGTQRSIESQRTRRSTHFTEWDGNLAGLPIASPADGLTVYSPTRLERWAACGFRYFLDDVLGLDEPDDPERIVSISPLDRGSVLHLVLERFIDESLAPPPPPDQPWS